MVTGRMKGGAESKDNDLTLVSQFATPAGAGCSDENFQVAIKLGAAPRKNC
jgi:hypothetical protein